MLDPEPFVPRSAPAGLHFIADKNPAIPAHDFRDDLEILLGWGDEAAYPLDRFGDKARDPPRCRRLNQFLHILRTADSAIGVRKSKRAAIAVGVVRMHNARLQLRPGLPGSAACNRHRQSRAAMVGMP